MRLRRAAGLSIFWPATLPGCPAPISGAPGAPGGRDQFSRFFHAEIVLGRSPSRARDVRLGHDRPLDEATGLGAQPRVDRGDRGPPVDSRADCGRSPLRAKPSPLAVDGHRLAGAVHERFTCSGFRSSLTTVVPGERGETRGPRGAPNSSHRHRLLNTEAPRPVLSPSLLMVRCEAEGRASNHELPSLAGKGAIPPPCGEGGLGRRSRARPGGGRAILIEVFGSASGGPGTSRAAKKAKAPGRQGREPSSSSQRTGLRGGRQRQDRRRKLGPDPGARVPQPHLSDVS